ncbi:hypothetical protein ABRZ24_10340 [Brenneria populi]|uniref:Uncharacterized protein n=1 Tax=Brenneria populi TaxID=1505588 RepID=A0ABU6JQZ2_9GAMM|nr:hypothetical protein [Brenneria populi Li et al. 2015]
MRQSLGFDPLYEVNTFAELARFPGVAGRLRDVPLEAPIPRGLQATLSTYPEHHPRIMLRRGHE